MNLNTEILSKAADQARGLCMDAVEASQSGHLGLPLGCAEIGAVLFGHALRYNPQEPRWINRDRFVLSAGHGSMFLYGWLHMAGYALVTLDQVKTFRQLGQGVANAVGMAISQKMASARFNTDYYKILDNHVVCLAGDGCLQEGVAAEASSLAGHLGLDNLILFQDSNNVTLDAMLPVSQSENVGDRYRAYGWDVQEIDGQNLEEIATAFAKAKAALG